MAHFVIQPLSLLWYKGMGFSIILIVTIILFFRNRKKSVQENFMKILGFVFFIAYIYGVIYQVRNGIWTIQDSLPLHLCEFSFILCTISLYKPINWMFEWCLYLSIPSAIHAILTPELTMGKSDWMLFDYYLTHSAMILVPLYLIIVMGMKVRKKAWIKSIFYIQILLVINLIVNSIIDANYMYLQNKPYVDNPLLFGDWPWYILVVEFIMIVHVLLIHFLFKNRIK
ncbi:TIGR02206 family membrane protein [bacterium]|nr:TIGR02206 family membrane protein [bacterium]